MVTDFSYSRTLLFLAYGLSFIIMGLAIMLKRNSSSDMRLSKKLYLLGAFGITHGLAEWMYIIIPMRTFFHPEHSSIPLLAILFLLIVSSYIFLLFFGLLLYFETKTHASWVKPIPPVLFLAWLGISSAVIGTNLYDMQSWVISEIWSRYLLTLPASLITGYALLMQLPEFVRKGMPGTIKRDLRYLAYVFFLYSFFGGIVVPAADFYPASIINKATFLETVHIPIQVFRSICGILMAVFTIRVTAYYDLEVKRILQLSQKRQAVLEERDRIARDLHDGIIQSIYGEGLRLENSLRSLGNGNEKVTEDLKTTIHRLNDIIEDIRSYIVGLRLLLPGSSFKDQIQDVIYELSHNREVNISVQVSGEICTFPDETAHEILLILKEAVSNAIRHAQAGQITVVCDKRGDAFYLSVIDDGIGFTPALNRCHNGIVNMQQRAGVIGGDFTITGYPERGTEVTLTVPCMGEVSACQQKF